MVGRFRVKGGVPSPCGHIGSPQNVRFELRDPDIPSSLKALWGGGGGGGGNL